MEATLTSKVQVTIPKAVRERLQINPGDRIKFFFHPDGVIILPKIPTARLKGSVPKLARPVALKEFDLAPNRRLPTRRIAAQRGPTSNATRKTSAKSKKN